MKDARGIEKGFPQHYINNTTISPKNKKDGGEGEILIYLRIFCKK